LLAYRNRNRFWQSLTWLEFLKTILQSKNLIRVSRWFCMCEYDVSENTVACALTSNSYIFYTSSTWANHHQSASTNCNVIYFFCP
jgi:hypothetical protein